MNNKSKIIYKFHISWGPIILSFLFFKDGLLIGFGSKKNTYFALNIGPPFEWKGWHKFNDCDRWSRGFVALRLFNKEESRIMNE